MERNQPSRFLELQALASLERKRFVTRRRLDGLFSGRHLSRQQGGAGEFVDYREYSPGDDLRRLDWKVLARTGRRFLRLYQDETNLMCTLVVDASGSMRFGGATRYSQRGSKLEYAQYLATALSHLISAGQDQVGLAIMAGTLEDYVPPGADREHIARVQACIENMAIRPSTNLGNGLRALFQRVRRRGVMLLISDFLLEDMQDTFAALRLFRHSHWELILLHLIHPLEERLPDGAAVRFIGMEREPAVNCSVPEIRAAYERRFARHCDSVRSLALSAGSDYHRVSTAIPYWTVLNRLLSERAG
jgi:uncharacterized protein (DUF58 family)